MAARAGRVNLLSQIPKRAAPDLIRGRYRFSEKIMPGKALEQNGDRIRDHAAPGAMRNFRVSPSPRKSGLPRLVHHAT